MHEKPSRTHSKLGIASCLIAVGVWIYFGILFLMFIYTTKISKFLEDTFVRNADGSSSFGAAGVFLIFFAVIFVVVPIIGHLIGFIFGTIGTIQGNKKRLFGAVGVFLNILPLAVGLFFYLVDEFSKK